MALGRTDSRQSGGGSAAPHGTGGVLVNLGDGARTVPRVSSSLYPQAPGKRVALPNSRILIYEPLGGAQLRVCPASARRPCFSRVPSPTLRVRRLSRLRTAPCCPMRDGTRVVHAGLPPPVQGDPFLPGPTFAGVFSLAGDPSTSPYTYGRYHNPTWSAYERALSELEGGETVAFASGIAAVHAVMGAVLRPGDAVVIPSDGYYTARALAEDRFGAWGVEVRHAPTPDDAQGRLLEGARLLWIETPTNPGLDVCDVAALAEAARDAGALVALDNTTATVLGQRPLALGADFSVASDTKALTGHGDLVLGHVAVRDADWAARLRAWRSQTGAIPGPMEVWLAHRSLGTLDVRFSRMCRSAQALAELLRRTPSVQSVRYPGLSDDPAHAVAAGQMSRFGSVVSFDLVGQSEADQFLRSCALVREATSFGGLQTTAERRARWGGDAVSDGFVRLSVGCEDEADLLDDVAAALAGIQPLSVSN